MPTSGTSRTFEHRFFKAKLAGRDLELRCACDTLHRFVEGRMHALICRVHRNEYGDAEDNSNNSQRPAQDMLLEIWPAEES